MDRAYRRFDRVRSKCVVACASDAFYDVYNDLAYASDDVYRPGNAMFRAGFFPFEQRAIEQHFPPPPASVLVGGAGGGREAFALARLGYQVVAFDPARSLVTSIARANLDSESVTPFVGRYEHLPTLQSLGDPPAAIDLRGRPPFEAAILGWASFSHLRSDRHRIDALRNMRDVTVGPMLVSYFPGSTESAPAPESSAKPGSSSGPGSFSAHIGYFHGLAGAEMRTLAEAAGLEVVVLDNEDNWPHAVLRRPR